MNRVVYLLLLLCPLLLSLQLSAQDFFMNGTPITACSGTFFDPGGMEDYPPETEVNVIVCPEEEDRFTLLHFYEIQLAEGDVLTFRDGDHADAPLIEVPAAMQFGQPFRVQASAVNGSGCLYVSFQSDATAQAAGWRATVECTAPCQRIDTEMLVNDETALPGAPLNLCEGDTLTFAAVIDFPQSGVVYHQSLADSEILWRIGNHTYEQTENVQTVFDTPGRYTAHFSVKDQFNCIADAPPTLEIVVSPGITLAANELADTYCTGEDIVLYTAPSANPQPPGYLLEAPVLSDRRFQNLDTLLLPDGTGGRYSSFLPLSGYPVGHIIGPEYPLTEFWIDMEHSYAGDLEMELICPSGQSVFILEFPTGLGNTDFGIANLGSPPPGGKWYGTPFHYRFSDLGENGKLTNYVTDSDNIFPAGHYQPEAPFTQFDGCPVNGDWRLIVTDKLGLDNGSLFGWGLTIDSPAADDHPIIESTDVHWEPADIIVSQNQDSVLFSPPSIGFYDLQLDVIDNFGCLNTAQHTIEYLPGNHPDCEELNTDPTGPVGRDNMYPIPFREQLHYRTSDACTDCRLEFFNLYGQRMGRYAVQTEMSINTRSWPVGIYFYRVTNNQGELLHRAQLIKTE